VSKHAEEQEPAGRAESPEPNAESTGNPERPTERTVLVMRTTSSTEAQDIPAAGSVEVANDSRQDLESPRIAFSRAAAANGTDYGSLDYSRWSPRQRFYKRAIAGLFRLLAPVDVHGLENIPKTGPVLLAVNHLSMLDIPVLLTILPRRGVCIATDSMRKHAWVRWFLDIGDTIWVRRGKADQDALINGLTVLRAGGLLGLAPEGTRSRTGGLMRGQTGVAYLAAEAPAPILPVAAYGQERILGNLRRLRRTHVHVRVGSLITVAPGEKTAARLQHETERVMTALADLLPPGYRGVYGNGERPEELTARRGHSR
jgi:1-acyl-sn-glycerol-3-phosphate acyltransferase